MFRSMHVRVCKIVIFIFLLIPFSGFGQAKKPIQKFKLSANVSASDYEAGVVWVKLKEKHKALFQSSSASGKALANINMQSAKPLISQKSLRNSAARSGPQKMNIDMSRYYKIRFDKQRSIQDYINELYATGYFEVIEPAYTSKAMYQPNDPQKTNQYYLSLIKAYDAWDITKGNESIVIGIVDSGGDLDHPDLASQLYINPGEIPNNGIDDDGDEFIDNDRGWDFSGADTLLIGQPDFLGDNNPSITKGGNHSHGTWAAGCASAATDNGTGISGVGFKTKLLFTKHYADNQPSTDRNYSSNLYEGVLYAAQHGAKIINCSWGGSNASAIYQDIISYVTLDLGCLVIASSGNDGTTDLLYPASYEYVISVAASDSNDKAANFTTYGKMVDITAPGVNTFTTGYNDIYQNESGTSFSAPIVSGAAALVWAAFPDYTPLQVGEQLRVSADPIVYTNSFSVYKNKLGKGRLDIKNALTIESPSIRASRPLLVKSDGNPPEPGETANLYLDFTNYLKSTSGGLEISISTSSPYLTIVKNTIHPGIIAESTTIRNTLDPFTISLKPTTPLNTQLDVLLTYTDGAYTDYQTISFVIPSFIDINENNITTTMTSIGRMGYEDPDNSANGSGFVYNDKNVLYEMGLIMGTSSTDLFNSVRGIEGAFDHDFTSATKIKKMTPGERSYSEVVGSFRNNLVAGNETMEVSYRSLVWKEAPYNNFVILEYTIKNKKTTPINDFYFGIFADWDISLNGGGDRADWDDDLNLGYTFPAQASNLPQTGIQELSGKPQYFAIDNDQDIANNPFGIYDGYTDVEKFTSLSSGFVKTKAGDPSSGNDVSQVVSSGPYTINAGEEVTIAFALHGATNFTELLNSAKYADSVYHYTFEATMPIVAQSEICYGNTATLSASGASSYNWYRDFTGGVPFHTGSSFTTPILYNDTTFYVSNADHSYESVRTIASVSVKGNPAITPSRSTTLCEGESVILQANEADEYLWSTGEITRSIVVSTTGDYSVTVKDNDLGCEFTSLLVPVKVNPSPTAAFVMGGLLTPGETILFTNESTNGFSYAWTFGDGSSSTVKDPVHTYTEDGDYTVKLTVTAANGCQDITTQGIGIITGVESNVLSGLMIYPNPISQDKLLIVIPDNFKDELDVSILNNQGKRVKTISLSAKENSISVSELPVGMYLVRMTSAANTMTHKIIIQR